jgi:hypothetical protein
MAESISLELIVVLLKFSVLVKSYFKLAENTSNSYW